MNISRKLTQRGDAGENLPMRQTPGRVTIHAPASPSLAVTYIRTLRRSRLLIAAFAVVGCVAGLLSTFPTPATWRSRVSLDIQALNENFMNMRAVDPNDKFTSNSMETFLQTEIKLLQSQSVLRRVTDKLKAVDPAGQVTQQDLLSRILVRWNLVTPKLISRNALIEDISRHLTVRPIGMTRLVEVTCESRDAALATDFCNTLASEFAANDLEVRWESAQKTSDWLNRQLADVRAKLQISEHQLEKYASEHSLLLNRGQESVAEDKLRQLQAALSAAQTDRMAKEAQFRVGSTTAPDSLPAVLDDEPSRQYQLKLAELRRQYAEVSTSFTAESPKAVRIQAQIDALETSIGGARASLLGRLKNEYTAALDRERALARAYADQEKLVTSQVSQTAQLNMLERETESGRQLYTSLLARVKEAGFASAMKSSPIRVVDTATIPTTPVGPRRALSSGIGLLFGGILGIAAAFYRERSDNSFRAPGDAGRHLAIREFGVIPSALPETTNEGSRSYLEDWAGPLWKTPLLGSGKALRFNRSSKLELVTWTQKRSLMAEAYRGVMSSLLFSAKPGVQRTFVISSPNMGEGKTTVVSNLGIALAETGRRVVVVDADLRIPRLHSVFSLDNTVGLSDLLRGDPDPLNCSLSHVAQDTVVPNLSVITSGSGVEDPSSLLHSNHLRTLIRRLERTFDIVLIDTPPLLHLADSRTIARLTSGMVLVLRAGVANYETSAEAVHLLEGDETPILGVILNDFNPGREAMPKYYNDYFRYQGKTAV